MLNVQPNLVCWGASGRQRCQAPAQGVKWTAAPVTMHQPLRAGQPCTLHLGTGCSQSQRLPPAAAPCARRAVRPAAHLYTEPYNACAPTQPPVCAPPQTTHPPTHHYNTNTHTTTQKHAHLLVKHALRRFPVLLLLLDVRQLLRARILGGHRSAVVHRGGGKLPHLRRRHWCCHSSSSGLFRLEAWRVFHEQCTTVHSLTSLAHRSTPLPAVHGRANAFMSSA